jgi:hypothetical protein
MQQQPTAKIAGDGPLFPRALFSPTISTLEQALHGGVPYTNFGLTLKDVDLIPACARDWITIPF